MVPNKDLVTQVSGVYKGGRVPQKGPALVLPRHHPDSKLDHTLTLLTHSAHLTSH